MSMSISRNRLVLGIVCCLLISFQCTRRRQTITSFFAVMIFESIICYGWVEAIYYLDDTSIRFIYVCASALVLAIDAREVLASARCSPASVCVLCKRKRWKFHRMWNARNVHKFINWKMYHLIDQSANQYPIPVSGDVAQHTICLGFFCEKCNWIRWR